MGTTEQKLARTEQSKNEIKNALNLRGAAVGDNMSTYANAITNLPSGVELKEFIFNKNGDELKVPNNIYIIPLMAALYYNKTSSVNISNFTNCKLSMESSSAFEWDFYKYSGNDTFSFKCPVYFDSVKKELKLMSVDGVSGTGGLFMVAYNRIYYHQFSGHSIKAETSHNELFPIKLTYYELKE